MPSWGRQTSLTRSPQSGAGTVELGRCGSCHYLHPKGPKLPPENLREVGAPRAPPPRLGAGATGRAHLKPTGIQADCRRQGLQGC